jgi:hypothetical protein
MQVSRALPAVTQAPQALVEPSGGGKGIARVKGGEEGVGGGMGGGAGGGMGGGTEGGGEGGVGGIVRRSDGGLTHARRRSISAPCMRPLHSIKALLRRY